MKTGWVETGISKSILIGCLVSKFPFPTLRGTQPREEHKRLHDVKKITRVHSFSRPEKLPLKIHKGSSRTFYLYWVEKALLFPNWSSFCRHMPSPSLANFLSTM
jgi:hypothetical protein